MTMLSTSVYPTWYPIPTAPWHSAHNPIIPYHILIPKPNLHLQSTGKGLYSRRCHRNGASSFTIDAILGVQQDAAKTRAGNVKVEEAVREMNIRREMLASNRMKLPRRYCSGPAVHTAFLPGTTHLSPPASGRNIGRAASDEKNKELDLDIFEAFRASHCVTNIHGTGADNGATSTIRRPLASLAWPCDMSDQTCMKPKRVRTIFTQDQLDRLEAEFARQQYMVGPERLYLASQLDLSESQVKVWFQNRRIKWRKHNFESQKAKLAQYRAMRDGRGRHSATRRSGKTGPEESSETGEKKEISCDISDDVMEGTQFQPGNWTEKDF